MALFGKVKARWLWSPLALLVFGVAIPAAAEELLQTYQGQIIVSPTPFPGRLDGEMRTLLKATARKDRHYHLSGEESWEMSFLAFLSKDPGGEPLSLVFYDSADPESQKKLEPVQAVDIASKKGARVLRLSDLRLSSLSGFTAGKSYLVRATQLKGGREVVLAEAQLTLSLPSPE
jgi:hypothetical protein